MNKAQLIDTLSDRLGSRKAATDAVEGVIDTVTRAVASGERVAITGFGVFERVARPARTGRNPRTGAAVKIKKTTVPKFKAGQSFKDVVSGAKKLPKAAASVGRAATGSGGSSGSGTAKRSTSKSTKKATTKKSSGSSSSTSSAGRTLASNRSSGTAKKSAAKKLGSTTKKSSSRSR